MKKAFILFFITIPLIDIYLFFKINFNFGFLINIFEIVFSFLLGLFFINRVKKGIFKKVSGFVNYNSIFREFELTTKNVIFSFAGSILLILPGIYSDFLGLLCFFSFFQSLFLFLNRLVNKKSFKSNYKNNQNDESDVFDGVFHHVEEEEKENSKTR